MSRQRPESPVRQGRWKKVSAELVRRDLDFVIVSKSALPTVTEGQAFKVRIEGQEPQLQAITRVEDAGGSWRLWFDGPNLREAALTVAHPTY